MSHFQNNRPITKAVSLLMDYAGIPPFDSVFKKIHFKRHHIDEIKRIVDTKIVDPKRPQISINELLNRLDKIKLDNPTGELAKRLHYIRYYLATTEHIETSKVGKKRISVT
jgi:hypothetical protein